MHGERPPVHTAASVFDKFCYENKDALSAGIIVAGWDKEVGPSVYNIPLGGGLFRQPWAIGGTLLDIRSLIPCAQRDDAKALALLTCTDTAMQHTRKAGAETRRLSSSSTVSLPPISLPLERLLIRRASALALAMSRDGSSGGVIRMCVITEDGVERLFVPGNELPKFWEGKEVLGLPLSTKKAGDEPVPMAIEA